MPKSKPTAFVAHSARDEAEMVYMQVRLPLAIREKLRTRAFKERRSLNGLTLVLIEQGLKAARRAVAP